MIISTSTQCIELVKGIQQNFIAAGLTLATAESCTSGLLAAIFTHHPGSSAFFMGGVNVYSNQSKIDLLKINPDLIEQFGAVSYEVAEKMAVEALKVFHSDFSISVTGVAGPGGGTTEKPVGTIYLALASHSSVDVEKLSLSDDRLYNRSMVCLIALEKLLAFSTAQIL